MSNPITDKAEVAIDFPDKFYMGSFGRESRFDVTADKEGMHLHLNRDGAEKRHVGFHVHYYLLEDILAALGEAVAGAGDIDADHKKRLAQAATRLADACTKG
ncbi:MAG: hypothetical protein R3D67_20030 [Hyphomicrobiaceae bacterium]